MVSDAAALAGIPVTIPVAVYQIHALCMAGLPRIVIPGLFLHVIKRGSRRSCAFFAGTKEKKGQDHFREDGVRSCPVQRF